MTKVLRKIDEAINVHASWVEDEHQARISAIFGYSLAESELAAKDQELARLREALEEVQLHIDTWADEPLRAIKLASKVIDKTLNPSSKSDKK